MTPGRDGALGELHLPHVVLGQHDLARGAGFARPQHDDLTLLAAHAPRGPGARAAGRPAASTWISPVQSMTPASSRPAIEVDQPRAADAERAASPIVWTTEVVVGRLTRSMAPRARAHPVADLCALEGRVRRAPSRPRGDRASRAAPRRSCRCRRRCADSGVSSMRGGEGDGHRVRPDEAGDEGQEAHPRLGRDFQEQVAGGKDERRAASPARRARGRPTRDRCRAGGGACTCCRR